MLYQWARGETERAEGDRRRLVPVAERSALASWTEQDQKVWRAAVTHYSQHVVARYLTFNSQLHRLKTSLCEASGELPPDLPYDVTASLMSTMPIYRRAFWADHDRQNRLWIGDVAPKLRRHEVKAGERLARAMGGHWPKGRLRADACYYANWAGAYTSQSPDHVVTASSDKDTMGWSSFELMLHEPCHTAALGARFGLIVRGAFNVHGVKEPERLWHALIFYTAGELTRDVLVEEKVEGFRSYAEAGEFWKKGAWQGHNVIFDAHWRPFLRGEIGQKEALARIATAMRD